ncbi:hypothetical protein [Chitinophaga sancti]|uniref:Uncharacterized protein n=1 Tax=Chitinophaga sancti TaxID=1004 RepID=A0A1K1R2I3_9BACT|nr:hypothetical protein [Chitinophaga sancti]WQD64354.1 hypothetical protein U0033_08095 [Chitinophaga sancti]WQG90022.1 hypothetical protein SR876_00825 [Chitinophaga sancti]SFW66121.1 hypothetical protein SAMN05661012_03286 [Chitinophaga sancti]
MNFEDIQSAWNKESNDNIPFQLPTALKDLKGKQSPVKKIRNTMRTELIFQLIGLVIVGFFPQILHLSSSFLLAFYMTYGFMIIISLYYFIRFYFFYNRLYNYTLNSKESLFTLYYDIKINIEMYRSFNYSLIPVLVIMLSLFIVAKVPLGSLMDQSHLLTLGIIILAISTLLVYGFMEFGIKVGYGRYLKEIGAVLDELNE